MILASTLKPDGTRLVVAVIADEDLERMRQGRPLLRYLNGVMPEVPQVLQLGIWMVENEAELRKKIEGGADLFRMIEEQVRRSVAAATGGQSGTVDPSPDR